MRVLAMGGVYAMYLLCGPAHAKVDPSPMQPHVCGLTVNVEARGWESQSRQPWKELGKLLGYKILGTLASVIRCSSN